MSLYLHPLGPGGCSPVPSRGTEARAMVGVKLSCHSLELLVVCHHSQGLFQQARLSIALLSSSCVGMTSSSSMSGISGMSSRAVLKTVVTVEYSSR